LTPNVEYIINAEKFTHTKNSSIYDYLIIKKNKKSNYKVANICSMTPDILMILMHGKKQKGDTELSIFFDPTNLAQYDFDPSQVASAYIQLFGHNSQT